jgi:phosphoribosylanthranilate isomerase
VTGLPAHLGRVWVKICGITTPDDAAAAAEAGADAVGAVWHPPSPRHVGAAVITQLAKAAAPVPLIIVAVDRAGDDLARIAEATGAGGVQLHGQEPAALVRQLRRVLPGRIIVRARRIPPGEAWPPLHSDGADAVLVDTHVDGVPGGTGRKLMWQRAVADAPVVVAGGLNPDNVAAAVSAAAPFGVDVSSGVESAPGRKDHGLMRAFVAAARSGVTAEVRQAR